MAESKKHRISAMLKSIETGDIAAVEVVNEAKYIQHNPETHEGSDGLAVLFKRLSRMSPRVNIVRAFEDGDYVFAHTEYNFAHESIGFEVFRFEEGYAVEHWDNIQPRQGPNLSAHSMVDGPTECSDLDLTEGNRSLVQSFVQTVLVEGQFDQLTAFIDSENYVEHSPLLSDDVSTLRSALEATYNTQHRRIDYQIVHRVLAEGNFVLCVTEGDLEGDSASFYDLFRVDDGKIVEHWDTTEKIVPKSEWKNDNGKF